MVASIAQLPREAIPFVMDQTPLETWLARVKAAQEGGEPWLTLAGDRLWRLPELWRNLF
jgi:hypothetical protein